MVTSHVLVLAWSKHNKYLVSIIFDLKYSIEGIDKKRYIFKSYVFSSAPKTQNLSNKNVLCSNCAPILEDFFIVWCL